MKNKAILWRSTRGKSPLVTLEQAFLSGLAPDGGLYVPEVFPFYEWDSFEGIHTVHEIAEKILRPFFIHSSLEPELHNICKYAFNFSIPLLQKTPKISVLEWFHGPTAAFKDTGARFLAQCLSRLENAQERSVWVATSGDTGGAVASAFSETQIPVVILFPEGKVSDAQREQLVGWKKPILSIEVAGDFDDCQRILKEAMSTYPEKITTSNSVNVGRLLAQMCVFSAASLWNIRKYQKFAHFVIPTGNLGNGLSALWAKQMGFPIAKVTFATNQSSPLKQYFKTKNWEPKNSVSTLASAMDVGAPSNFERLIDLFRPIDLLFQSHDVFQSSDERIQKTISEVHQLTGEWVCPHTACAWDAAQTISHPTIVVATAHPGKFKTVVPKAEDYPKKSLFEGRKDNSIVVISAKLSEILKKVPL
ncbi:MAG: threonine synthase [Bdellovibrionaceae bacterium]|nr:threonine synthase [Pseudobdellovibrionaceae bacterium]|tara:strand:+ start:2055 stop:3311 length:1257 start_codon:yes stop_codon:yes gene_type:complete